VFVLVSSARISGEGKRREVEWRIQVCAVFKSGVRAILWTGRKQHERKPPQGQAEHTNVTKNGSGQVRRE